MKKKILALFLAVASSACLAAGLSACGGKNISGVNKLELLPLSDGSYSVVSGNAVRLKKIVIPATHNGKAITAIESGAFKNCDSLESITIPDSVTSIGDMAFYGCKSLESITIPDSVTSIGSSVFRNCDSLKYNEYDNAYYLGSENNPYFILTEAKHTDIKSCVINEKTKFIYEYAFSGCRSLESMTIPDSLTSIGYSAFNECKSLKYNEHDNAYYLGNEDNPYVVLIKAKNKNIESCAINGDARFIYDNAFYNCGSLENITIPDRVTCIGYRAFGSCSKLISIMIGNGVTKIGEGAFYYCKSLNNVTFGSRVTDVGNSAFFECSSLESVKIPDGVTSIGSSAFESCRLLTNITFNGTKTEWNAIKKASNWNSSTGEYIVHCTDGDVEKS